MNQIDPNVPQGTRAMTERPVSDLDLYIHTPPETEVLSQIREGMRVVDVNGEELGKVEAVQFGDPEAVTVSPIVLHDRIGLLAAVFDGPEPHVAEPFFSHLLRVGFVKIDGRGWIDTDYYVTPDMVKSVSGNTVMLKAPKDRVITEL
jgi:hypothetical protein